MGAQTAIALFIFPIMVVILSIFMQGGILTGTPNTAVNFCTGSTCAPAGSTTVVSCNNLVTPCKILPGCSSPPAPAWCFPWPLSLIPSNAGTWLDAGATVILTSTQFNAGVTATTAIFPFTSIGPTGWIVLILIGVGVAVLAGLNVLGSGLSPEAIHILWMGGVSLGIWFILSAFDGFLTGSANSLFAYLNSIVLSGQAAQMGTALWMICTLLWVLGTVSLVSRGN